MFPVVRGKIMVMTKNLKNKIFVITVSVLCAVGVNAGGNKHGGGDESEAKMGDCPVNGFARGYKEYENAFKKYLAAQHKKMEDSKSMSETIANIQKFAYSNPKLSAEGWFSVQVNTGLMYMAPNLSDADKKNMNDIMWAAKKKLKGTAYEHEFFGQK